MGHGARGKGQGAWGVGQGAWGKGRGRGARGVGWEKGRLEKGDGINDLISLTLCNYRIYKITRIIIHCE